MSIKLDGRFPGLQTVFHRTLTAARMVVRKRARVARIVRQSYRRLSVNTAAAEQLGGDVHSVLRLLRAWAAGTYRELPWRSLTLAAAAILYFLNPVDLIPDALIGIGFVDDAFVISTVIQAVHRDLRAFERWEAQQGSEPFLTAA